MKPISKQEKRRLKRRIIISFILGLIISSLTLLIKRNTIFSIIAFFSTIIIIFIYFRISKTLKKSARINKIEEVFPDFLQLMSSNLRAGITIDKAILLSSRPEFAPLDKEITQTGKDITTGKNVETALLDMSKRIGSDKIKKIILLIISGIASGGDIAILLEETSVNMREKKFIEKRAASNVLMYVIFIFLVVSIFAPALFSLSTVLVEVLTNILSGLPAVETSANLPFTLSQVNISINFIKYFSLIFITAISVFSSLVLGLVNKGEEKEGLKYLPIILILAISIFFLARIIILRFMSGIL